MKKVLKWIKTHFGKGFTFMVVPNSSSQIRSISIPFSAVIILLGIILFNLYIFIGFTTQVWQIYQFRQKISQKNQLITELEKEQREVKPTLEKSRETFEALNRLKAERERLLSTWRAIQQKSGRYGGTVSRGISVRSHPYAIQTQADSSGTILSALNESIVQLDDIIERESDEQNKVWKELLAYENRLDHTPSIWPVASSITSITSWFGNRRHPKLGFYRQHSGVDLQAAYGSKVLAAADGVVRFVGWQNGYGHTVIIDHGYNYQTLYAHNSRLVVRVGQQVKKGQLICYSGNSGISTGPHLHYEVRIGGKPVNPMQFLRN